MIAAGTVVKNSELLAMCEAAYSTPETKEDFKKCNVAQYDICVEQGKDDICEVDMALPLENEKAEEARQALLSLSAITEGLAKLEEVVQEDVFVEEEAPAEEKKQVETKKAKKDEQKEEVKENKPKEGEIGSGMSGAVGAHAGVGFGSGFKTSDGGELTKQLVSVDFGITHYWLVDQGTKDSGKDRWLLSLDAALRIHIPNIQYKSDGSEHWADATFQPKLGLRAHYFVDEGRKFAIGGGLDLGYSISKPTYATGIRSCDNTYFFMSLAAGFKWRVAENFMIGGEYTFTPRIDGAMGQKQEDFVGTKASNRIGEHVFTASLEWLFSIY